MPHGHTKGRGKSAPNRSGKKLAMTSAGTTSEHLINPTPVQVVVKGWAPARELGRMPCQLVSMPCKTPHQEQKKWNWKECLASNRHQGSKARSNWESKTFCWYVQGKWKLTKNKIEILRGRDDWGENGNAATIRLIRKLQKSGKTCYSFHTQPTTEPQVSKYVEDFINPLSIFLV